MARIEWRDGSKERTWRRLLRQWRRSGLGVRAFCAQQRLSEPSFYSWRRAIAVRDRERGVHTDQAKRSAKGLSADPVRAVTPAAFVKVDVGAAALSAIDVVLAQGRLLRVRPGFDANLLRQLVRVLEEPSC